MALEAFIIVASAVVIYTVIAALITFLVISFLGSSILLSRITFALFCGLICHHNTANLVANNFLDFALYAVIAFAVIMLLSLLPRTGSAIKMFCTVFMSVFAIFIVISLGGSVVNMIAKKGDFVLPMYGDILVKAVSFVFALGALIMQHEKGKGLHLRGAVAVNFDRVLASLVIGASAGFLYLPFNSHWEQNDTVLLIIIFVTAAIAFAIDFFVNRD